LGTIALEGIEFFAYHGYSDEEQKVGNKYSVDIYIRTDLSRAGLTDHLADTIDYEQLYLEALEIMKGRFRLLEHVASRIIGRIRQRYPTVEQITVRVSKFNPPIGGVCQRSSVMLEG